MKPSDCFISDQPQVGEYIMTCDLCVGVLLEIDKHDYIQYFIYNINKQCYERYSENNIVAIREEYIKYTLQLTPKMRDKIYLMSSSIYDPIDYEFKTNLLYIHELELLDDFVSRKLTRETQNIILADGIKCIIGREKNKGIRIIKLNNGQIWKAHRVRFKHKPFLKKIKKQYICGNRCKNHSTYYELICQLS